MTSARDLPDVPAELVDAGVGGRLVVLVGAGASMGAGLPSWSGLLSGLLARGRLETTSEAQRRELEEVNAAWGSLDDALKASAISSVMGADWIKDAIARSFREAAASPTAVDRALTALPGAAFVTTNYDQLLEAALEERTGRPPRRVLLDDLQGIGDFRVGDVLKLHGDIDAPKTIVLETEDYYRVGHEAPRAWKERLKALLQPPYQVLLVGYGYGDVDVQEIVNELRGAYAGLAQGPYWLKAQDYSAKVKARAYALRPIWLKSNDEVVPWVEALAAAIEADKRRLPAFVRAAAYADLVREDLRKRAELASRLFQDQRYADARSAFQDILDTAQHLSAYDPDDPELRRWIARSRLNVAGSALCLQAPDARDLVVQAAEGAPDDLSDSARAQLAMGLAQTGELSLARGVLPVDDADDDVKAARQLIELKEGKLPPKPWATSPILRVHLAGELLDQGHASEGARMARELLREEEPNALLVFFCLTTLVNALQRSVLDEQPLIDAIPIADRAATVEAIERHIDAVAPLPEAMDRALVRLRLVYFSLTYDEERKKLAADAAPDGGATPDSAMDRSMLLARDGKVDEALALVEPNAHPWRSRFERAQILATAGRLDEALAESADLARLWPGRVPIEHLLAELLVPGPTPGEALPHAQAAFEALPGRGLRLLLGRCLLAAGRAEEAWETLLPLAGSKNPVFLRARALAAEQASGRLHQSPSCWDAYLEVRPRDHAVRVRLAQLLFQAGDLERAANAARRAIDEGEAMLLAKSLYTCAQIIRAAGGLDEQARSYVRRVADALHTRFPSDGEAEHYRFMLLGALGFPEDAPPIDFDRQVAAGTLALVPIDQMAEALRNQHVLRNQVYEAYRKGHLPFESLCELTDTAAATYLVRFLHVAADRRLTALSAPVALGDTLPVAGLKERRILAGELELLLLERFGLWRHLREELGEKGRLLIFEDIRARLVEAAGTLAADAQRVALERQEQLLHLLTNSPGKISLHEDDAHGDDDAWAAARGVPMVVDTAKANEGVKLPLRRLVGHLGEKGYAEPGVAERFIAALPPDEDPANPLGELPERLCLSYGPLQRIFEAGILDVLVQIDGLRIEVGPEAMATLRWRQATLREQIEAADLGSAVHRAVGAAVAEGWMAIVPRPVVARLPDVRDQANAEWVRRVRREPLERGLSFRQALIDDPDLLLLAADFFVTAPINFDHALALAWPSPQEGVAFIARMRPPQDREIHFPALLRFLRRREQAALTKNLFDLAKLGFAEALAPEDILALALKYGPPKGAGIDGQEPKQVLARLEWMVREPGHFGASIAFVRLADVYAKAISDAFCAEKPLRDDAARSLTTSLLNRAEAIGENWGRSLVDLVMEFAVSPLVSKPALFFEQGGQGQTQVGLSVDSPGGKVWSCLVGWAGAEGPRRAAYARALRRLWLRMDELTWPGGPTDVQASGLLLAIRVDSLSTIHPEIAAPSILSANWKLRPLADIRPLGQAQPSLESLFERGARLLESAPSEVHGDEHILFFNALRDRGGNPEVMPAEAVLLRMSSREARSDFARHLARLQGPHDGRAYVALQRIANDPGNDDARRAYARLTVNAPWRLVRDDPTTIRAWGWHAQHLLGKTVTGVDWPTLREVLSEPKTPLDAQQSLWDGLTARASEGGVWSSREDRVQLLDHACEVPGLLPAILVHTRLKVDTPTYAADVAQALRRLDAPNDQPAARLAADIFFLRVAASRRPHVPLAAGEIDLRERLPERLVTVLRSVAATAPLDSLAHVEAGILRLCGEVVQELSIGTSVSLKDWLWLTYRLYQWLCAQLDTVAPDARLAGLTALRRLSPAPRALSPEANDLLNPFRFDGARFDHRLATVLHALGFMEELPSHIAPTEQDEKETPRAVTSTALEEILVALAARPLSDEERSLRSRGDKPSCLDWHGPSAVPDLALHALLQLNSGAILSLPEEARLRWIQEIPRGTEDSARLVQPLADRLLAAVCEHAKELSGPERVALEARLRDMQGEAGATWRWVGFTALYGAGGLHLEDEVRTLLAQNLAAPNAPQVFATYLLALSQAAPDRLEAETERVLTEVEARHAETGAAPEPVAFAWGLGAVVIAGNPASIPVAQDLLRRLAGREPYQDHEQMRRLLGLLKLS